MFGIFSACVPTCLSGLTDSLRDTHTHTHPPSLSFVCLFAHSLLLFLLAFLLRVCSGLGLDCRARNAIQCNAFHGVRAHEQVYPAGRRGCCRLRLNKHTHTGTADTQTHTGRQTDTHRQTDRHTQTQTDTHRRNDTTTYRNITFLFGR